VANLTRINNNQITDAISGNVYFGINANTKVQPYSITSTLLANNLTYGSDLTITGNLSVTGNVTAIDTTNLTIEDPLLLLASNQSGSPTVDIGYIGQRGTSNNIAFVWNESLSSFVTVYTDSGAAGNTTVNILSYADLITGNANVTGNLTVDNISLTGNVITPLNVTGNIVAGNIISVGEICATGNITADYYFGNGSQLTGIVANVSKIFNGNSSANISTSDGNLVVAIGASSNTIATFYDSGVNFVGPVSVQGNITTNAALNSDTLSLSGNVTSTLNVTGNVIANNVGIINNLSAAGNVTAANFTTSGTQGNITGANVIASTTLTATGNVYGGNILTAGLISSTGNLLTNGNLSVAGNTVIVGDLQVQGNVTFIDSNVIVTEDLYIILANNQSTYANINNAGLSVGPIGNALTYWQYQNSSNAWSTNVGISATANVTSGNLITSGFVTAVGNIQTANYFIGDGSYISNINGANLTVSKISNGNSYANIASLDGNLVIAVGANSNVTATFYDTGVNFGGNISVNGNITGANFVGNLSGGLGSNLNVNNYVINGGNYGGITLAMPVGFGANLSSAYEGGVTLAAGTSGTTAGTLVLDQTGNVSASGNVVVTGNLTGANILTAGEISATGTATVGNVLTAGNVSATGNLISGNILTSGYISSTGNIQSGTTMLVDVTTGTVTLGANITQTTGATLAINATDSILLPVGNVAQRPGSPATGMLRYNSTVSQCEIWNGAAWVPVGGSTYTVIQNEQFNGDGSTVTFTLGSSQTTDSCIVTINGIVQIPTTAYSVSGVFPTCVLTFTEAPSIGDTIDVREITTTTSVTAISNSSGNSIVSIQETIGQVNITGNLVAQLNSAAPNLTANSAMTFRLVNNTTLAILVRGTDGVTRTANITLT
jgi:hypothetical protein